MKIWSIPQIYALIKQKKQIKQVNKTGFKVGLNSNIRGSKFGNHCFLGKEVVFINSMIDDHSYVNNNTEIRNTKIGKYCSIASNVKIVMGYHPTHLISTHPAFYSANKGFKTFADRDYFVEYKGVEIGNDVWIGEGAIIPGGVLIGDGAIILARAVVTKDIEPFSIVGGIPARHMKYRFNEEERKLLLNFKWWNKEEYWLQNNFNLFLDKSRFFDMIKNEK